MRSPMNFPRESNEIAHEFSKGKQWNHQWNLQGKVMIWPMRFPEQGNEISCEISKGKQWNRLWNSQEKAMKSPDILIEIVYEIARLLQWNISHYFWGSW
jgi:hypothetical protein